MRPQDFRPEDLFSQISALERALDAERQARQAAEETSGAKSRLLATVSHEVRTPLGAIMSIAELLLAAPLDDTQKRYAETLQSSARGLLAVLNGILDHARLDAGHLDLAPVAFDLHGLIGEVRTGLAARAQAKGLGVTVDLAEGCPRFAVGDPVRLRQVLDNLTDNAVKFTHNGGVGIRVGYGEDGASTVLRFEVYDTGIGIADEQRARLFQPYAQADPSVAATYGGTGLGLFIARRLAELMGGELGCESVAGTGSRFWFTVRVSRADAAEAETGAPPEGIGGPLAGRVLIVEDNAVNQMLIAAYLDKFGLRYRIAANGREALEHLDVSAFDLVLMDVMMPQMDGLECTEAIRARGDRTARLPIVALTANAMKGDRETYLAHGMNGYVCKPVHGSELFAALAEHLPPQTQRRAAGS